MSIRDRTQIMPEELGVGGLGITTTGPKLNNTNFKAEQPAGGLQQ